MAATAAMILAAYPSAGWALANKIVEVSNRLGIPDPAMLANVIYFESGYTFSPSVRNPNGGATGLIQFYPRAPDNHVNDTASRSLSVTTSQLAAMSAVDQMEYVYRYFLPLTGRLKTQEDVYMAVYYVPAVGRGLDYPFPSNTWAQNPGIRTARDYVTMANARARLTPTTEAILSAAGTAALTTGVAAGASMAAVALMAIVGLAVAGVFVGSLASKGALWRKNPRGRRGVRRTRRSGRRRA